MESTSRQFACAYCSFLCVSDEALIEHVEMIHNSYENHNLEQGNFIDESEIDVNDDVSENFDENDDYSAVDFVACEIKEEPPDQNGIEMDDIEAESMDYSNHSEEDLDSQTLIHDEDSQESQEKRKFSEKELKERSHEKLVERREDNVQIGREKRAKEKADKGCERQNCDVCNVPITMYNMQRHMLTIHKEDYQYTCNINLCEEKLFDTWQLFKDHRKEVHEKDRPEMRCDKCGVNFKYSWTYNKHMQRANCIPTVTISNERAVCKVCQESFLSKQLMRRHIMDNHKDIELFKCPNCVIILPTRTYLNLHIRKKHKLKTTKPPRPSFSKSSEVKCPACQTVYSNLQFLKKHIVSVHRNEMDEKLNEILTHDYGTDQQPEQIIGDNPDSAETFKPKLPGSGLSGLSMKYAPFHNNRILLSFKTCFKCENVNFESKEEYHDHMVNVHNLHAKCDTCEKRFKDQPSVRNHLLRVHKIRLQLKCVLCEFAHSYAKPVESHYREAHGKVDPGVECFKQIEVKINPEPVVVKKEVVEIETDEKKPEDVPVPTCEQCNNLTFETVQESIEHNKVVHKRTLVCEDCYKCYGTPQSLKKHRKKIHNFVQKYRCNVCSVVIKSEYHMRLHFQASHLEGNATFTVIKEEAKWEKGTCHICNKVFQDLHKVKNHIATVHDKVKPFKCLQCDRLFSCRATITKHNLLHHEGSEEYMEYQPVEAKGSEGKKPLQCPVCNVGFTRGKQLAKHIKKFHPTQAKDFLPLQLPSKTKDPSNPLSCQSCGMGLRSEKTYRDHMKLKHPELYTEDLIIFHCYACEEGFNRFKPFVLHTFHEHGEEGIAVLREKYPSKMKHVCQYCAQLTFANEAMFQKHVNRCELKKELGIGVNKIKIVKKNQKQAPAGIYTDEDLAFQLAFEGSDEEQNLLNNDSFKNDSGREECNACSKTFKTKGRLLTHVKKYHGLKSLVVKDNDSTEEVVIKEEPVAIKEEVMDEYYDLPDPEQFETEEEIDPLMFLQSEVLQV